METRDYTDRLTGEFFKYNIKTGKYSLSKETKKIISESTSGKNHHNWGCNLTPETKKRISKSLSGKNHWNWKGGITSKNKMIRGKFEIRLWRESVFKRDDWTCQKCKEKGVKLAAHHIRNFSEIEELRTSIENGITFCRNCHRQFHREFGFKQNNIEQINKFLLKEYAKKNV